jgi:hypothetical protein
MTFKYPELMKQLINSGGDIEIKHPDLERCKEWVPRNCSVESNIAFLAAVVKISQWECRLYQPPPPDVVKFTVIFAGGWDTLHDARAACSAQARRGIVRSIFDGKTGELKEISKVE